MQIPDEQERETIRTYDMHAESWANEHSDRRTMGYGFVVEQLRKRLPTGLVLEVGAGGGSDGDLIAEAGYGYFGTDASIGMVEAARKAHPRLEFEQCSVYDLPKLRRKFDGFWACAVLLHIPKSRIDEALQGIAAVVKADGVGFISMKDGKREEFEQRESHGRKEDRLFAYWPKVDFEQALKRNGFKTEWYMYKPVSERTNWHWFIVRKS